jgi:pilus assembly protein CpaB
MMRIIILVVAIGAGSLAAWLALSVQSGGASVTQTPMAPPPQVRMMDVLVASSDIGQGQLVGTGNLRWQSWPESAVNETFITQKAKPDAVAALNGHMARSQFVAGEPCQPGNAPWRSRSRRKAPQVASSCPMIGWM